MIKEDKLDSQDGGSSYEPDEKELKVRDFLKKRIENLKKSKKDIGSGVNFEEVMKSADREYAPRGFDLSKENGQDYLYVENQDEITGLRGSRLTPIKDLDKESWRSNISEPTLLIKIQTALSILIDQNPEAIFKAINDKYSKRNNLAKALWKRNWELNESIEVLKLFVFDLAKYGWAVGHTVPRLLRRKKDILETIDTENPENNKYRSVTITEFNDIYRETLNPYRTWIDEKASLRDKFSINDWYYEIDYSYDYFKEEFSKYKNFECVKSSNPLQDTNVKLGEMKSRKDFVTVGFYEGKKKDLYSIFIPKQDIVLYYSPLPNDDGKLTLWQTYWLERNSETIYGIGLFELLKNNKVMYDRFKNMEIDQLTQAIYPMLFYTGSPMAGENVLKVAPDTIAQKQPGTTIDQVKIDYDQRAPEMEQRLKEDMDDATGISPTLQGQVQGKTLGEVLHAKDSALKRLNIPLINIAKAIETDAYLTLSWMNQVYSIPEVKEFVGVKELEQYEQEFEHLAESFEVKGDKVMANFYPKMDLGLEEDRDGQLIESPERRFFTLSLKNGNGLLPLENIKWEGKISIKAKSIVSPNPELERQRKLELFNVVMPTVQAMSSLFYQKVDPKTGQPFTPEGGKQSAIAMYKPLKQILEIQDENPEQWIPKDIMEVAENPDLLVEQKQQEEQAQPLFIDQNQMNQEEGQGMAEQPLQQPGNSEISNPLRKTMGSMQRAETKASQSI